MRFIYFIAAILCIKVELEDIVLLLKLHFAYFKENIYFRYTMCKPTKTDTSSVHLKPPVTISFVK